MGFPLGCTVFHNVKYNVWVELSKTLNFLFPPLSFNYLPFPFQVCLPDHPFQNRCALAFQQWWFTPLKNGLLTSHLQPVYWGQILKAFPVISLFSTTYIFLTHQLVGFSGTNLNIFFVLYSWSLSGALHTLLELNFWAPPHLVYRELWVGGSGTSPAAWCGENGSCSGVLGVPLCSPFFLHGNP